MRLSQTLLVAVAAWSLVPVQGADKNDEAAAIAKVKSLGGQVERLSEQPPLRTTPSTDAPGKPGEPAKAKNAPAGDPVVAVDFIGCTKLQDEDLSCLRSFPELMYLYLGRTRVSDAGLVHVAGLKHLMRLGLIGTKVTDAGLRNLHGLDELQELYLANTAITDAGLAETKKIKNLRFLYASSTKVTGAWLRNAEVKTSLRTLDLSHTGFADAASPDLAKFPELEVLSLDSTPISDAGLKGLAGLHNLNVLDLSATRITDDGLEQLAGLKKLKRVSVEQTKVTSAGLDRLRKSLPETRFTRQPAGQRNDPDFDVTVRNPAYASKHPEVLFDEAHQNFHTAGGRYKVFADLITNDGYRVTPNREPLTSEKLAQYSIFVSANAPAKRPTAPSAFTEAECKAVEDWVRAGGALLLITDHEPFASGSEELGKRFGVDMSLLTSTDPANQTDHGLLFSREKNQLGDHAILRGRDASEQVNRILTFVGQSLKGPPGSVQLLKFSDTAQDVGRNKKVSAAGRAQGIAFKFGKGRVVVMGEAGDLSAQVYGDSPEKMGMNVPGCDNRQFALNLMHWLSGLID
jgi:hypothetical protein